jgi:hypothetical protein
MSAAQAQQLAKKKGKFDIKLVKIKPCKME